MWKRIVVAAVLGVLFIWMLWNAICAYWQYKIRRADFETMTTSELCRFEVDFTRQGKVRAPFHHVSQLAGHGIYVYIRLKEKEFPIESLARECKNDLGNGCAVLQISGNDAASKEAQIQEEDMSLTFPWGIQETDTDGTPLVTATRVFLPKRAPLGDYEITLDIQQPVPRQRYSNVVLIGRYGWCGLERIPHALSALKACFCGILALVLLGFLLSVFRKFRKVSRAAGKKTMYVLSSYPRWSETFLRQDILLLKQAGVSLHLVSLFPGDCKAQEGWPEAVILQPGNGPAIGGGKTRRFLPAWLRAKISLYKHRRLLGALVEQCRNNGIGHIHAEFADLAALLASETARRTGCSYSVGIHAVDIHAPKYPNWRIFGHAAFVLVCNQEAALAFRKQCPWAKERLHLIYHGIHLEAWPFAAERPLLTDILHVLFLGRLVPKKGIPVLLEALEILLHHHHQKVDLTIVGTGPMEEDLKKQIERLEITEHIRWTGRLERPAIQAEMQKAHCLCMPSIVTPDGDRDGIPNVVAEAMAAGLPVVGSQAGSLPEILTEETGWPIGDLTPVHLATELLELAAQPEETERRRKNARNLIEFRFNAKKLAENRAELFRNVKTLSEVNVK